MKIDEAIEELKQYFEEIPEMRFCDASVLTRSTVMVAIEALESINKISELCGDALLDCNKFVSIREILAIINK